MPFHRLQKWNKKFFESTSLKDIGYVLYMGHGGYRCPRLAEQQGGRKNSGEDPDAWCDEDGDSGEEDDGCSGESQAKLPAQSFDSGFHEADSIAIVHSNGVHQHKVLYCSCSHRPKDEQLLECQILPSTWARVRTGFTLEVLDDYLLSSVEGKVSIAGYWGKIVRLTNNCFPHKVPVGKPKPELNVRWLNILQNRYREFGRATREWRRIKLHREFGYGHDLSQKPSNGDLASFCVACPQPEINLHPDWKSDPRR